jgi:hypothetical protein
VPLLAKPLARRAGGAEHHGVGVFPVYPAQTLADDPEWNQLVAWVSGAFQPVPVDSDCATMFDNLGLKCKGCM